MDIAFETELLRQICVNKNSARKKLGACGAEWLMNRIADMRAADSIDDLVVGLRDQVEGRFGEVRALDLVEGYELVFVAHHLTPPWLADNRIDWTKVSRVKVISIRKGQGN